MPQSESAEQSPLKGYREILKQEIITGLSELRRSNKGLFLSSLSAGLNTGFSVLLMAVVYTHFLAELGPAITRFAVANAYSVGFILVILGRSELFTEHTSLAVLPVLDGRAEVRDLGRLWSIVFAGNILGSAAFALLLTHLGPAIDAAEPAAFSKIALHMVEQEGWAIFLSAVLAGWLMGEAGWLVAAARDTVGQILCVWGVTTTIGLAGLHHVVVGTGEVIVGFSTGATDWPDLLRFLLLVGSGNAFGGVVFVAMIKYGHAIHSEEEETEREVEAEDDANGP